MKSFKILLLTASLSLQANACLWKNGTTIDGSSHQVSMIFPAVTLRAAMKQTPESKITIHISNNTGEGSQTSIEKESRGVEAVLSGNYDLAVSILSQLETEDPGRYSTAVNLGTAYELKGEIDLALKWISEGIRRNPDSHMGTEWLHVQILKTKMRLRENPDYLSHNHVINLPENYTEMTAVQVDGNLYPVKEIARSIKYQLLERMLFVKPPDPVVADLICIYGEIEGHTTLVESGIKLFELAKEYGYPDQALIDKKIQDYQQIVRKASMRRKAKIIAPVILFLLFLVYAWRKKWFFITRAAYQRHLEKKAVS